MGAELAQQLRARMLALAEQPQRAAFERYGHWGLQRAQVEEDKAAKAAELLQAEQEFVETERHSLAVIDQKLTQQRLANAAEARAAKAIESRLASEKAATAALRAQAAAAGMTPGEVRLKTVGQFRLIGTAVPRRDSPSKANGSAVFGLDVRPEGMLYAAVKMSPVLGGTVASVDTAAALKMPGVAKVVDFSPALAEKTGAGAGVAVVAARYWQARQAAAALPVVWLEGVNGKLSSADIYKRFAQQLDDEDGHAYHTAGDMDEVDGMAEAKGTVRTLKAEYRAPFLAHAAMEPLNCTAQVKDGKVRLWVSTQVPTLAIDTAAKVAGVKAADVTLEVTLLGGGFGRRLEADFIAQAVAVAKECDGAPVQLIWSREDDTTHDVYRPAALARFAASLDAAGNISAWDNKSVSASVGHQYLKRSLGLPALGPDMTTAEGEFDMQYEIPNQRIRH
eukprot:gene30499-37726_t